MPSPATAMPPPSGIARRILCSASLNELLRHQLLVEDLVGPGPEAEVAPVGSIEGQDHEDHEADEPRKQRDLCEVEPRVVEAQAVS